MYTQYLNVACTSTGLAEVQSVSRFRTTAGGIDWDPSDVRVPLHTNKDIVRTYLNSITAENVKWRKR